MNRHIGYYALYLVAILVAATGCSKDDDAAGFAVDKTDITMDAQGGTESVSLTSDAEWTATTNVPWLSVTPANGNGSTQITIRVDTTLTHDAREADIRLATLNASPIFIKVHQFGYGREIIPDKDSISLAYSDTPDNRVFSVNVSANVEFDIKVEYLNSTYLNSASAGVTSSTAASSVAWITPRDYSFTLDRGARPRTATLTFDWAMNTDDVARDARIHLVPKVTGSTAADADINEAETTIAVHQAAAPTITDDRAGDSLAIVLMNSRMNSMTDIDVTENMMYWDNVTLWEATDKDLPAKDAVGRVRYVSFALLNTTETIAPEVKYLKYLERLSVYGNFNTMLKSITLGSEVCQLKHLKYLQIAAYGLVALPDDFYKLGSTLETLDLNSNNFDDVPTVINKQNFPKLKKLNLSTCRRWTVLDLRTKSQYDNGIGLNINFTSNPNNSIKRLFLWDSLEQLALSYNFLEGELPEFKVGEDGVTAWTQADVSKWGGDTIRNMVGRPKVLPACKDLRINLNFFTGNLPEWILYHPHLLDWNPESFIFTTQENGIATNGKYCGFDNVPDDYEYYYNFFPGYRTKYSYEEN